MYKLVNGHLIYFGVYYPPITERRGPANYRAFESLLPAASGGAGPAAGRGLRETQLAALAPDSSSSRRSQLRSLPHSVESPANLGPTGGSGLQVPAWAVLGRGLSRLGPILAAAPTVQAEAPEVAAFLAWKIWKAGYPTQGLAARL